MIKSILKTISNILGQITFAPENKIIRSSKLDRKQTLVWNVQHNIYIHM